MNDVGRAIAIVCSSADQCEEPQGLSIEGRGYYLIKQVQADRVFEAIAQLRVAFDAYRESKSVRQYTQNGVREPSGVRPSPPIPKAPPPVPEDEISLTELRRMVSVIAQAIVPPQEIVHVVEEPCELLTSDMRRRPETNIDHPGRRP